MRNKKVMTEFLCFLLAVCLMSVNAADHTVKAAEENNGKRQALAWLLSVRNEDGTWGDVQTCNDTCNAYALLCYENEKQESTYLNNYQTNNGNTDELAHLLWATGEEAVCHALLRHQNPDGGFGLTDRYTSEPYDTAQALMALAARSILCPEQGEKETQALEHCISWLAQRQGEDGGFAYNSLMPSDASLSADIGIALLATQYDLTGLYEKLDAYCLAAYTGDFSGDSFAEQARLARYLYRRERIPDTDRTQKDLAEVLLENGSVNNCVEDTIQYILLMEDITQYHTLKPEQIALKTSADSYVLEAATEQEVSLVTEISYETNRQAVGWLQYSLSEEGKEILNWTEPAVFPADRNRISVESRFRVTAGKDKTYELQITCVLQDGKEQAAAEAVTFAVHEEEKKELLLDGEVKDGEEYEVRLGWNDISGADNRYGYRVFRRKGDGEWETRSTWDGEEKVKVLNIYPVFYAENYVKDWMEKTLDHDEEPAGKGLFEIDTVEMYDFNRNPEAYLMDGNGEYRYDVLVIGVCNGNGWTDISDKAYDAVNAYLDTGRGVLFGHDTVSAGRVTENLSGFAERLGILLKSDYKYWERSRVKVVNTGFLTSYPWKLSGDMEIPLTHVSGQFTGVSHS